MKKYVTTLLLCLSFSCAAMEIPLTLFPLDAYTQDIESHLWVNHEDYHHPLLEASYQQEQLTQFYEHYYSTQGLSPWSEKAVSAILPLVYPIESQQLLAYDNTGKDALQQHYAENFRPHDASWWQHLQTQMQLTSLQSIRYEDTKRAIVTENTAGRNLPEEAPDFFHASLAGQGFPFDNLQDSSLWVGTPIYVIATSEDKAWSLVITPDAYITWIKTKNLAFASEQFIKQWQTYAKHQLIATMKTDVTLLDSDDQFLSSAFIGSVFPLIEETTTHYLVALPFRNKKGGAEINTGKLLLDDATKMPLILNKANIATLLSQLKNRPYGWGGAFFFNDCSQELKSLFTPFGLWLPRNSAQQSRIGSTIDLSNLSNAERLQSIQNQSHPLLTLIYIPGHIMLYVGNEKFQQQTVAMTYQNVWGLSPASRDMRYVIGQSVFLPLLNTYPEAPDAHPLFARQVLKLVFLDNRSKILESPASFSKRLLQSDL